MVTEEFTPEILRAMAEHIVDGIESNLSTANGEEFDGDAWETCVEDTQYLLGELLEGKLYNIAGHIPGVRELINPPSEE